MSTSYISTSEDHAFNATSLAPAVPGSVTDDDILFAHIELSTGQSISSAPSGWASLGNNTAQTHYLYWKLASSESGTYEWTWSTSCYCRIQIAAYRGGFDTADPIDAVSNTDYTTSNTTLRAASFSVTADNSTLIFAGGLRDVFSKTFSPPTNPGTFTEDVDTGDSTSDVYFEFAHYQWSSSGSTGNIDATISAIVSNKHAFCVSLNPETNPFTADGDFPVPTGSATFEQANDFTAAGNFPVPTGSATFENSNDFTADGDFPVPTGSAAFENLPNQFTAAGDFPLPDGAATFAQENPLTVSGDLPVPTGSGTFENLPNYFTGAGEFPAPTGSATFEQANDFTAAGELPLLTGWGEFEEYHDPLFTAGAWAIYGLDAFGNDTDTPSIWERSDSDLDLTPGDGATSATFPTFTDEGNGVAYYAFDGVDDYLSDWPTMPDEYTVVIAKSSSYPDGQPEIQSCNDTTIKAQLTNPGTFTGNLHSLLIFDYELSEASVRSCEQIILKRLWRDTFVDPYTARRIRDEEIELCLYCEEEADRFDDYSLNAIGYTDYSTVWDEGLTFPTSGAALVMDSDAALNLEVLSIFIEAPNFDTESSAETILQNGTNYVLSIALSAGTCTLTLNGSDFSFTAAGYRTLGITVRDGENPKFYLNGSYAGEGDATCTVDSSGAGQLTIGNNTAKNNPFASTLKKLFIDSEILKAAEIRAMHFGAMADRSWTP